MSDFLRLKFEKKFDSDITNLVRKYKIIYHICPNTLKDKIKQQGITPHKSKWKEYNHDERCYFFLSLTNDDLFDWVDNFKKTKKQEDLKYMLLGIKTSNLNDDIKFYLYPRMKNGIYTLEGISPDNIVILKDNL